MSRPRSFGLTTIHERIVKAISRVANGGVPPSVGELVSELGLAGPSSLDRTLTIMKRNGFIQIHGGGNHGKRRTITLSSRSKALMGQSELPVLGTIPAGPLVE